MPYIAAKMASTTARGSAARMTSPITATPCAPAERQSGAFSAVIPPSAIDRARYLRHDAGQAVETDRRAVARLAGSDEDRADGDIIGAGGQQRRGFLCGMRRGADHAAGNRARAAAGLAPLGKCTPPAPAAIAASMSSWTVTVAP